MGPELVSKKALHQIAEDAMEEFDRVRAFYTDWGRQWDEAERALRNDLREVGKVLEHEGLPELPPLASTSELLMESTLTTQGVGREAVSDITSSSAASGLPKKQTSKKKMDKQVEARLLEMSDQRIRKLHWADT